jgi:hypothetical protein
MEQLEIDINREIEDYCNQNWGMCLADESSFRSGPNADCEVNCVADGFVAAGAAIGGGVLTVTAGMKHGGAVAAGRAVSVASVTLWGAGILGAALVAVGSYHIWKQCKSKDPMPRHLHLFEPVY